MKEAFENMAGLAENESRYLCSLLRSRLAFMFGEAIGLSYLLDPVYLGEKMEEEHRHAAEHALYKFGSVGIVQMEENREECKRLNTAIYRQWAAWTIEAGDEKEDLTSHHNLLTSHEYWAVNGSKYPALKVLANRVFGMV